MLQKYPSTAFKELSFLKRECSFTLAAQLYSIYKTWDKEARDQRYLRGSSGLAATEVAYLIDFVHLPVSIHIDAFVNSS